MSLFLSNSSRFNDDGNLSIEIFDLDGTLTEEFSSAIGDKTATGIGTYSYWNLITRDLVSDKSEFDTKATAWKRMVTTTEGIDRIESSKDMTEIGMQLFCQANRSADAVQRKAAEITKLFFKHGIVITEAIEYLKYRLSQNVICVISTASYEDGAKGFVDGLVECGLIPRELTAKIVISGTQINWEQLKVTHMNVDGNKLLGIERIFRQPIDRLRPRIHAIFGDDPAINDRALLSGLCDYSFVIKTVKNASLRLPACCIFSDWIELTTHRDQLEGLHKQKKAQISLFC